MINRLPFWCPAIPLLTMITAAVAPAQNIDAAAKQRTFLFTYAATVTGLRPGQVARVWLPEPPSDEDQRVTTVRQDLPAPPLLGVEPRYGNHLLYIETPANADGSVSLRMTYRITRREVAEDPATAVTDADADLLKPDALVPVGGKPVALLAAKTLPADRLALSRLLYDTVDDHMQYRKDQPGWGRGDAVWACDSRFGNCTDFHSLFISLARSNHLPAKFEMGFPIPEKRGAGTVAGYHCWAKVKPQGHGWVPVDISEANKHPDRRAYFFGHLCENRVAFTTGRDLVLTPKQDGPPLNFFVYPYVEVDGKPYPAEHVEKQFSYEDVPATTTAPANGAGK
jgi:transglutaminase-like putative cysteine protease